MTSPREFENTLGSRLCSQTISSMEPGRCRSKMRVGLSRATFQLILLVLFVALQQHPTDRLSIAVLPQVLIDFKLGTAPFAGTFAFVDTNAFLTTE